MHENIFFQMTDYFSNVINDVYRLVGSYSPSNLESKLNRLAVKSERKQARVCLHKNDNDLIHLMYICHLKDCKVRIHKHIKYPEWIVFLKAKAKLIYFDEFGKQLNKFVIDTESNGSPLLHLIPKDTYHNLKFEQDSYFLEIKQGPFNKKDTNYLNT